MTQYTSIAIVYSAELRIGRAAQVAREGGHDGEPFEVVYLLGGDPEIKSELERRVGRQVLAATSCDELPAGVVVWRQWTGFWAAVNIETHAIRDVTHAEDTLMAEALLLSRFAPGYREQFCVKPVDVSLRPD